MNTKALLAALALAALPAAGSAATLNFLGDVTNGARGAKNYVSATVRGTLTCAACAGLDSSQADNTGKPPTLPDAGDATGFSGATFADLFDLPNAGDATEVDFVDAVMAKLFKPKFTTAVAKVLGTGGDLSFTSSAAYLLVKLGSGPNYALVKNTSQAKQSYAWAGAAGMGAGLSHYVEFGSVCQTGDSDCDGVIDPVLPPPPAVPVPAAGLLLATALGGLTALRRRRR